LQQKKARPLNLEKTLVESLRGLGWRLTPQRMMILSIISASRGHITAEDIHARVREHYPYIDISTIYRTLELLREHRLITETDLGHGRAVYELRDAPPHHHAVCRMCGGMLDLDHTLLQPLQSALQERYSFAADIDHFAIFGLCRECQSVARRS